MAGGLRWSEQEHAQWKAREAKRCAVTDSVGTVRLILPWPPSGNHATRHANGAHYLTDEHRAYREQVAAIAVRERVTPIVGPLRVQAQFTPPDKRRRDLDNNWKVVGDALQHAGVYADDCNIEHLELQRVRRDVPAHVVVVVEPALT